MGRPARSVVAVPERADLSARHRAVLIKLPLLLQEVLLEREVILILLLSNPLRSVSRFCILAG